MTDPTARFSSRVEAYVRYRPTYPDGVIALLERECSLAPGAAVADIGSGTGILSRLFLEHGCRVYGVEPNREMRVAGEHLLGTFDGFISLEGRAEATTLPSASVDIVVAGQAFHWFDPLLTRAEFARILKPQGWVVLVWNKRLKAGSPFAVAYERLLLGYSVDYTAVDHERVTDGMIAAFFHPCACTLRSFGNAQVFDYAGLEGRLMSSSYVPEPGHPNHGPMIAELRSIFEAHQRGGTVTFEYDTQVYFGRLEAGI